MTTFSAEERAAMKDHAKELKAARRGADAVADADGRVRLFDVGTGEPAGPTFKAADGFVISVHWSPDGRTLLTSGTDGQTKLFDAETGRQIGSAFLGQDQQWAYSDFSPDGSQVAVIYSADGQAFLWPSSLSGWTDHACDVARRDFTREEWERFVPGHPYERICTGAAG